MRNFKVPQFSTSIPEMWSKWHISLTTWFRDYLFIWLASIYRKSTLWRIFSTIILFLVIGFWHGANYTFIVFGLVNGLFFIPRILSRDSKKLRDLLKFMNTHIVVNKFVMFLNFIICSLVVIFFRSPNITHSYHYFNQIFALQSFNVNQFTLDILPLCLGFFAFEWITKDKSHPFDISEFNPILRKLIYVGMIVSILIYGYYGEDPFYYFQF
jgi:D-alanyl-lipoteichoic acid acyltransferase DltB (MBOAT superfamily)